MSSRVSSFSSISSYLLGSPNFALKSEPMDEDLLSEEERTKNKLIEGVTNKSKFKGECLKQKCHSLGGH